MLLTRGYLSEPLPTLRETLLIDHDFQRFTYENYININSKVERPGWVVVATVLQTAGVSLYVQNSRIELASRIQLVLVK